MWFPSQVGKLAAVSRTYFKPLVVLSRSHQIATAWRIKNWIIHSRLLAPAGLSASCETILPTWN